MLFLLEHIGGSLAGLTVVMLLLHCIYNSLWQSEYISRHIASPVDLAASAHGLKQTPAQVSKAKSTSRKVVSAMLDL